MPSNANFRSPVRLVLNMLRSGSKPARAALIREAFRFATYPLDMLLSMKEQQLLKTCSSSINQPLILIVGPPRAGTTIVYQFLANSLQVSFPTNLSCLFSRSPIASQQLANRYFGNTPNSLENYFGQTEGLLAPNDAFAIWNRWLGGDRYACPTELSSRDKSDMRCFFQAWTTVFPQPFLNKNNRNTNCINLLAKTIPTAHFIVVNRDPVELVRSLIRARVTVQGAKTRRWGLQSLERSDGNLGYVDDVCQQVVDINLTIQTQLANLATHRFTQVDYADFCANPQSTVINLLDRIPGLERSHAGLTYDPTLTASSSRPLSALEEGRITEHFRATDESRTAPLPIKTEK